MKIILNEFIQKIMEGCNILIPYPMKIIRFVSMKREKDLVNIKIYLLTVINLHQILFKELVFI